MDQCWRLFEYLLLITTRSRIAAKITRITLSVVRTTELWTESRSRIVVSPSEGDGGTTVDPVAEGVKLLGKDSVV